MRQITDDPSPICEIITLSPSISLSFNLGFEREAYRDGMVPIYLKQFHSKLCGQRSGAIPAWSKVIPSLDSYSLFITPFLH